MAFIFPSGKFDFSVDEAASALGVSTNDLLELVAKRLADGESVRDPAKIRFRPADLIMLDLMQTAVPAEAD